MSSNDNDEIITLPPEPNPMIRKPRQDLKNSRCCFHFTKYETFIAIVGVFGVIASVAKITIIVLHIPDMFDHYPVKSTYIMAGFGIFLSAVVFLWEIVMLYCVRKRKITGLRHYMFASLLMFIASAVGASITGPAYQKEGLVLSLSFCFDAIRTLPQMFFVHMFIKSEKLAEDSHLIAAYYKRF